MSTIRIPVPRPVAENDDVPARGGAQEEELRRIERRAERFLTDQAVVADDAVKRREQEEQLARSQHMQAQQARAISARAQTLRAEANTELAVYFAAGTVAALILGSLLVGKRSQHVPYERLSDGFWR